MDSFLSTDLFVIYTTDNLFWITRTPGFNLSIAATADKQEINAITVDIVNHIFNDADLAFGYRILQAHKVVHTDCSCHIRARHINILTFYFLFFS